MFNFLIFFLSFSVNLAIIKLIPNESIRLYINIYTIIGGIGALLFFIIYTRKLATSKIKNLGYALLAMYALAHIYLDGFWVSVAFYPLFLIYNDYIASQSDLATSNRKYRYFLIASIIPFFIFHDQFYTLFSIRVAILAVILFLYTNNTRDVKELEVKSTWKYIFFNYSFYYIPLLLISNISHSPSALKVWYIFTQGGLVVYLKYLDYALRKNNTVSPSLNNIILAAAIGAPILPTIIFPSGLGVAIYFIGLLGLIYSKRYISMKAI